MTSPVDEGTPTIILNDVELWPEIPPTRLDEPSGSSGDVPEKEEHHVFERLKMLGARSHVDVRDPYFAQLISAREFIAAAEYYDLERDVARALRVNGALYGKFIRDGLFARMIAYLKDFDIVDVPGDDAGRRSLDTAHPIIIGELHCPHVEGAEATFRNANDRMRHIGIDVTATGAGGGGWAFERLYSSGVKFTVKAPTCMLLVAHLRGHYVVWQHRQTGERMVLTNVSGMHPIVPRPLSTYPDYQLSHLCEMGSAFDHLEHELDSPAGAMKKLLENIPLKKAPGAKDPYEYPITWSTTREYTGQWGLDIDLGGPKLSAGVSYKSQFVKTIEVTQNLVYGYHYVARYQSARELPQQWAARRYP